MEVGAGIVKLKTGTVCLFLVPVGCFCSGDGCIGCDVVDEAIFTEQLS